MTTPAHLNDYVDYQTSGQPDVKSTSFAQVRRLFNGYNELLNQSADVTLTNPAASMQNISFTSTGHKVILPPMNADTSLAPGQTGGFAIINAGTNSFDIVAADGSTTVFAGLTAGEMVLISVKDNNTSNGNFITQLVGGSGGGGGGSSSIAAGNAIIGGDFSINPWQRGTSFAAAANLSFFADCWQYLLSGSGVVTIKQGSDAPTQAQAGILSSNCAEVDTTTAAASLSAGDYYSLSTKIEGYDFKNIAQQACILTFWVKSHVTGIFSVALQNSGNDRSFVAEYTVNNADTWELKTILIPASPSAGTWNYTNGTGLQVYFPIACGSTLQTSTIGSWQTGNFIASSNQVNGMSSTSNVFKIQFVQLVPGSTAIPYIYKNVAEVLERCRRYYQKSYLQGNYAGSITFPGEEHFAPNAVINTGAMHKATFGTSMRAAPTVNIYSTGAGTSGNVWDDNSASNVAASIAAAGNTGVSVLNNSGATLTANNQFSYQWTASADM